MLCLWDYIGLANKLTLKDARYEAANYTTNKDENKREKEKET